MKRGLILAFVAITGSAFTGEPADTVFKKMYDQNYGKHYKTFTFKQNTGRYRNDSLISNQVWTEHLVFPDKLRIDIGNLADERTVIYSGDSTYSFMKGVMNRKVAGQNDLIFLLGGMYFYPYDEAKTKLIALGFNPELSFSAQWKGRPVHVVGAAKEGELVNQFWVDDEKQVIVRMLQFSGGRKQESIMSDHIRLGNSWAETTVHFYVNDKLLQIEKYFDCKADEKVDMALLSPYPYKKLL